MKENVSMKLLIISIVLLVSYISCSNYDPCNQYAISYGMLMEEVNEILGYPDKASTFFDTTYFIYNCEEKELWIGFEGGAVASIETHKRYW